MTNEDALTEVVRSWAEQVLPGHPEAAETAAAVARRAFHDGASVSEACQLARSFALSWSRHPAHWPGAGPWDEDMHLAS